MPARSHDNAWGDLSKTRHDWSLKEIREHQGESMFHAAYEA
ncbi:hypothetical protein ACFO0U_15835 [Chromohalobacter sarecensis]|uniref:Uncharacterized protein n=1 Tax=Chromohalobacter sarecensis TaxID=245294 RepID=A0ABV9D5G9_9GAMM|nr:hypothetical protein [Chromohalobacter sarecensis]